MKITENKVHTYKNVFCTSKPVISQYFFEGFNEGGASIEISFKKIK